MLTDPEKKKAEKAHIHDLKIKAVRLVGKGANGCNGILLAKSAEEPPADAVTEPAPEASPQAAASAVPAPAPAPAPASTAEVTKDEPPAASTTAAPAAPEASTTTTPAPDPAASTTAAPTEVEKAAAKARIDLNRKVWGLIHSEIDNIIADGEAAPGAETEGAEGAAAAVITPAAKAQVPVSTPKPSLTQQTLAVTEVHLPEELKKALEQVPALVAKVAEQETVIADLRKERTGSRALVAETPAGTSPVELNKANDPWFNRGADIFEIARREREAKKAALKK